MVPVTVTPRNLPRRARTAARHQLPFLTVASQVAGTSSLGSVWRVVALAADSFLGRKMAVWLPGLDWPSNGWAWGGKPGRVGVVGWGKGGNAVANWEGQIRIGQESDAHAHWRANKEDRGGAIHLFVVKVGRSCL